MDCINCGAEVSGAFCSKCGQRAGVHRITIKEVWFDFWARIYGFDGMFPRTIRDLTLRPGKAARTYIGGNRVTYYGPVGYFFLMITVFVLLTEFLDVDFIAFMKGTSKASFTAPPKPGSGLDRIVQDVVRFVTDNLKLMAFVFIPLQAIVSKYLLFRSNKYNFLEHMVLPFYVVGHVYWLSMLSVIYFKVQNSLALGAATAVISLLYFSFAYSDFFDYQSRVKAFLKGFGVYVFSQILFALLVLVALLIALAVSPEFYDLIKPSNNR